MTDVPDISYVKVGDADVAYQIVGSGPFDLIFVRGLGTHLVLQWAYPAWVQPLSVRLASFSPLILFDQRGTRLSDGLPRQGTPTTEEWAEDIGAVLDAAGSDRAAILAQLDAGPLAMQFAATHPERVSALVLANTSARFSAADDYPMGVPSDTVDALVEFLGRAWGTPELLASLNPEAALDPDLLRWWINMSRSAATPRAAAAQYAHLMRDVDVRLVLPLIQAPTLVLHYRGNSIVPIEHARYIADRIEGAKLIEMPGNIVTFDPLASSPFVDEIIEFLTGERPEVEVDRILTTVLFTNIVGSTERAARRSGCQLGQHIRELGRGQGAPEDNGTNELHVGKARARA